MADFWSAILLNKVISGGECVSGFEIKKAPSEKKIPDDTLKSYFDLQTQANLETVRSEKYSDSEAATLYILPGAFRELNAHIHWKRNTASNLSEQGGVLIGNVYKDEETHLVCGVVQHIIASDKAGDATYIQFTHEDWIQMYREFEEKFSHSDEKSKQLNVIGWYHTHPNMPVVMSGIDKGTHIGFFPDIWQFSVIFNPQRGIWAVFNGNECENCNGVMFYCKEDLGNISAESEGETEIKLIDINREQDVNSTLEAQSHFVVKRRSYPISEMSNSQNHIKQIRNNTASANHNSIHSDYSSRHSYVMPQRYPGKVYSDGKTCYYFPINKEHNTTSKSYVISESLFRHFSSFVNKWSLSNDESVAVIYYLYEKKNHVIMKSAIKYYTFDAGEKSAAVGFIYSKNSDEFINYSCDKTEKEVSLVVLYSSIRKSNAELNWLYGQFDCCLWINPVQKNEFEFWIMNKEMKSKKAFNIQGRNMNAKRQTSSQVEQAVAQIFDGAIRELRMPGSSNLEAVSMLCNQQGYYMKASLAAKFLEKVYQYSKFKNKFVIIVSYRSLNSQGMGALISPFGNEFMQIVILGENNGKACLEKLNSYYSANSATSKFAFIISNRNIDIETLRNELLLGYSAALCVNIETQEYTFIV